MKKDKKNSRKLIVGIVVLIFCVFGAQKTFALKRAIFPDAKSLQSIPTYAHPNISGNINSTVGIPQFTPQQPEAGTTEKTTPAGIQPQNAIPTKNNTGLLVIWLSIVFLIIFALIFVYRKLKQK